MNPGTPAGRRGRPRKPAYDPDDPEIVALERSLKDAKAEVRRCVAAHEASPTQAATVDLLNAQFRHQCLRADFAQATGDGNAAKHESELAIKWASTRDAAVARLWGDELRNLHALVNARNDVHAQIAAELAAEQAEEISNEPDRPTD